VSQKPLILSGKGTPIPRYPNLTGTTISLSSFDSITILIGIIDYGISIW